LEAFDFQLNLLETKAIEAQSKLLKALSFDRELQTQMYEFLDLDQRMRDAFMQEQVDDFREAWKDINEEKLQL